MEYTAWIFCGLGIVVVLVAVILALKSPRQRFQTDSVGSFRENQGTEEPLSRLLPEPESSPAPQLLDVGGMAPSVIPEEVTPVEEPDPAETRLDPIAESSAPSLEPAMDRDANPEKAEELAPQEVTAEPESTQEVAIVDEMAVMEAPEPEPVDLQAEYSQLDERSRLRFASLAVMVSDFSAAACAAVWNADEAATQRTLEEMVERRLLSDEPPGRFQLSPEAARFAEEEFGKCVEQAALDPYKLAIRYVRHSRNVLAATNALYEKSGDQSAQALEIFRWEWPHIETGQAWVVETLDDSADPEVALLASDYAFVGATILGTRLDAEGWLPWLEAGLKGAQRLGNRQREGNHLSHLASAWASMGEEDKANELYSAAYEVLESVADPLSLRKVGAPDASER